MTRKKLIHQLTTEELLNGLETTETEQVTEQESEQLDLLLVDEDSESVSIFLRDNDIAPGEYTVKMTLVFKYYFLYSKHKTLPYKFHEIMRSMFDLNDETKRYYVNKPTKWFYRKLYMLKHNIGKMRISSKANIKNFEKFVKDKKIEEGNKWIPSDVVFELYRWYTIDQRMRRPTKNVIRTLMKIRFKYKVYRNIYHFKLNEESFKELPEEVRMRIINFIPGRYYGVQKKRKKGASNVQEKDEEANEVSST